MENYTKVRFQFVTLYWFDVGATFAMVAPTASSMTSAGSAATRESHPIHGGGGAGGLDGIKGLLRVESLSLVLYIPYWQQALFFLSNLIDIYYWNIYHTILTENQNIKSFDNIYYQKLRILIEFEHILLL